MTKSDIHKIVYEACMVALNVGCNLTQSSKSAIATTTAIRASAQLNDRFEAEINTTKKPVAWRCKDYADGWIIYHREEEAQRYEEDTGCLMQPLYVK